MTPREHFEFHGWRSGPLALRSLHVPDDPSFPNHSIQLAGQLLLAAPSLHCTTFRRSVILLAEHDLKKGAFGLILNHPTGKTVGEFLPDEFFTPLHQLAVHHGGPVEPDQLTFSSFWWSPKRGLRWALRISAEDAAAHSQRPGRIVRAFIGYSGWSAGQLETELRSASWITAKPKPTLIRHSHDRSLWTSLLRSISPLHTILAEAPDDPSLN
jgi:putative transcriptional regulator